MEVPAASSWRQDAHSTLQFRAENLPATTSAATRTRSLRTPLWRDLASLALLCTLVIVLRGWLICHSEVAARDSIGFIRYALELERLPWTRVLRDSQQHPGYPVLLLVTSWPVRHFCGGTNCYTMQLSAQLASSLASVLLVIPMYFLGRDLFNRSVGFWGTVLFQCLPVCSRILADGLSEATFLLFTTAALVMAVRAFRGHSAACFALCGVFSGLAYLTRPEGALIVAAAGLVLLGVQLSPVWRQTWKRALACGGSLVLAFLLVGGPFVLIIGKLTVKPTPLIVLEMAQQKPGPAGKTGVCRQSPELRVPCFCGQADHTGQPLLASILGVYCPENLKDRRLWGLEAIGIEVIKGYQYFMGVPVLLGMWWFRDRLRVMPGAWVVLLLCLLHMLVLWRLAAVVGYVSDRHVLILVLCGIFTGAAALLAIGHTVGALLGRLRYQQNGAASKPTIAGQRFTLVLLVVLALSVLPEGLKPLHANRIGHREAGLWLAEHSHPADPILDPFCWAHYYAGRVFSEGFTPQAPAGQQRTCYVVLESSDHDHPRLPTIGQALALARQGKLVYHWPTDKPQAQAKVCIFAVPVR